MVLKVVKNIVPMVSMQIFTKTSFNMFVSESIMILKKRCDKRVTLMNNKLEILVQYNFRLFPEHWWSKFIVLKG